MRVLKNVGASLLLLCLSACSGKQSGDVATFKKLVGTWELTKHDDPLVIGSTMEFMDNLQVKYTVKVLGASQTAEGTFAVEGDTIMTLATTKSGKEIKDKMKIKTLNDTTLIVEDPAGKVSEYKKK
jgi:uncharacterized protein (TIGR03066 family)